MYSQEVVLTNKSGFHARPASLFVKEASKYISDIKLMKGQKEYNGKSIMGILTMGAAMGDKIFIQASGEDEKEAVDNLVDLIKNKFNE